MPVLFLQQSKLPSNPYLAILEFPVLDRLLVCILQFGFHANATLYLTASTKQQRWFSSHRVGQMVHFFILGQGQPSGQVTPPFFKGLWVRVTFRAVVSRRKCVIREDNLSAENNSERLSKKIGLIFDILPFEYQI